MPRLEEEVIRRRMQAIWAQNEEMIKDPRYGCTIMGVMADPPFTYTIGLTDRGWPELIISGLRMETASLIINNIVKLGERPVAGETAPPVANYPLIYRELTIEELIANLVQSIARQVRVGGPPPKALQVIFPDERGIYPHQPGCDPNVVRTQTLAKE